MKARQRPGVVFQPQVHQALQRGIHKMVGAIRPTLGPLAGGVVVDHINKSIKLPEYLDDGGVISRRILQLPNRDEDMGAMLVRTMIYRQYERIGDGTATAAVLFQAIFDGGLRYIIAGGNAMQLRRYLENALPVLLDELDRMKVQLEGQDALTAVARSLCNDDDMAALLGEAFDLIGAYGRLEIREDYGRTLRREYVEGTYYHTGLFSTGLLVNGAFARVSFDNPHIFLCDFEIDEYRTLFPVLQTAHAAGVKSLVIVARSMSDKAIPLLVANNGMEAFKAIAVKLPGLNPTDRMHALEDLSKLTGATAFIQETGETLEGVRSTHFGQARRIWADSRAFGIVGGGGDPVKLRQHVHTLKRIASNPRDADERKRARERIANLMGSSVTLWVGGFTETEINARKSVADRAALALRSAVEEGVLPGGGIALLNCRTVLERRLKMACDTDERAAYRILIDALDAPARAIYANAGYDSSEVMAKLALHGANSGFDVVGNRFVNMCDAGILDSVLTLKTGVRNAISTAALALTIDSLVHLAKPEIVGKPEL